MNKLNESVLIVEDDAPLREALIDTLRAAGLTALAAGEASEALRLLASEEIALVISDVQMPGPSGYELLSSIKRLRPHLPVVLMTAYGTVAQAVAAMREGATDYIVKPFDAQALIDMARRQLAARVMPNELVAVDPESRRTVSLARKIAESDATVLITGESGTGKEVFARFIRDNSVRADRAYVAINCAAIPENMLEATLFGYEKGAFTGALAAHAGKFEQAQGGTLLLDEISEMNLGAAGQDTAGSAGARGRATGQQPHHQSRCAPDRHLESRSARRGARGALSRRPLLPAQRDVAAAARVARAARRYSAPGASRHAVVRARRRRPPLALSPAAEHKLLQHDWPGNARELTNIVQRAAWLAAGGRIDAADLDLGGAQSPRRRCRRARAAARRKPDSATI